MIDKNGREIRTGDVVLIEGAFFKNDNRLYFVENSPGDPNWYGGYYSLRKISKRGKISTAKYSLGSWPIHIFTTDRTKAAQGHEWNKEHATIEIVENVPTKDILLYFAELVEDAKDAAKRERDFFGENAGRCALYKQAAEHYKGVIEYLKGAN